MAIWPQWIISCSGAYRRPAIRVLNSGCGDERRQVEVGVGISGQLFHDSGVNAVEDVADLFRVNTR